MMEILALLILLLSFLGMLVIFIRKIPVLVTLSPEVKTSKPNLFVKLKDKAFEKRPFKSFSFEIFLQKSLSKIRILVLKIDHRIANCLQRMRAESRRKKEKEQGNDNYWDELKKKSGKKRTPA